MVTLHEPFYSVLRQGLRFKVASLALRVQVWDTLTPLVLVSGSRFSGLGVQLLVF